MLNDDKEVQNGASS